MINGPMLNAYPDSMGGTLKEIVNLLSKEEFKDTLAGFYILPSIYNTDLDRGFSVIDYSINKEYATTNDLETLKKLGIQLKLDFILNHQSVLSKEFQDILKNGENSKYKDYFINWNKFWEGTGNINKEGYIVPDSKYIEHMFFRKPGLPILMVRYPDGKEVPYWNTFYQEVKYPRVDQIDLMQSLDLQYLEAERLTNYINQSLSNGILPKDMNIDSKVLNYLEGKRQYLGQMDVNIQSPLVWQHYEDTLKQLSNYGASIVRLDAFAYAPKAVGRPNFLNEPETWDVLDKVKELADQYHLELLPEIHATYQEKTYLKIAEKGYLVYDFFLPGLLIYTLDSHDPQPLINWIKEIQDHHIHTVNMLGCHDGIPVLDIKGLLTEEQIQNTIDTIVSRGGYIKNLEGKKNMYYQVNATYYSALGEDDRKMLLARAIQMFMPGIPQIWYLDILAGKNNYEALKYGHKEINRTNLSVEEMEEMIKKEVVLKQLDLLRLRNTHPAFGFDADLKVEVEGSVMIFTWQKGEHTISLKADLETYDYEIK